MAIAARAWSARSISGPTRRSTAGPAIGAPTACASSITSLRGAPIDEPRGARLRDGRRQRAAQRGGPSRSWRRLDRQRGLAAARHVDFTPFHLHGDGRLDPAPPDPGAAPLSFDFDPAHPVPTIGGAFSSLEPLATAGAFDQIERPDFFGCAAAVSAARRAPRRAGVPDGAAAPTPITLVGPIEADLFVATDGPDTDFTAKLIDVHPPTPDDPRGFAMQL